MKLFNSPKWLQFIGDRNVRTIESAQTYIRERMVSQRDRLGYSTFTVILKGNNTKVGICGLYDRPGLEGIDIGFSFLPAHEKKGYAFESASKLKEVALTEFGLTQLNAITVKENIDSQKLLEKLGLTLKGPIVLPNTTEEVLLYQLI